MPPQEGVTAVWAHPTGKTPPPCLTAPRDSGSQWFCTHALTQGPGLHSPPRHTPPATQPRDGGAGAWPGHLLCPLCHQACARRQAPGESQQERVGRLSKSRSTLNTQNFINETQIPVSESKAWLSPGRRSAVRSGLCSGVQKRTPGPARDPHGSGSGTALHAASTVPGKHPALHSPWLVPGHCHRGWPSAVPEREMSAENVAVCCRPCAGARWPWR